MKRCVLCKAPAEFSTKEGIWRHSGQPWITDQMFCNKYGYPIEVEDQTVDSWQD